MTSDKGQTVFPGRNKQADEQIKNKNNCQAFCVFVLFCLEISLLFFFAQNGGGRTVKEAGHGCQVLRTKKCHIIFAQYIKKCQNGIIWHFMAFLLINKFLKNASFS